MGLITFCALAAFTLLYLSASIKKKPPAVEKALVLIKANMNYLGAGCVLYGFFAAFVTPLTVYSAVDMIVRLVANLLLIVMAGPYAFTTYESKVAAKINGAILDEMKHLVYWPTRNEKYLGLAGATMCGLVFVFVLTHI